MSTGFFEGHSYFIDEKVNFFKFENTYQVYNDSGRNIGSVRQRISLGHKLMRILINKAILPFKLEIVNTDEQLEATISRGWTLFMSKIKIHDANENLIGSVNQKFKFFKPVFRIFNNSEIQIAEITGDWKAWNFNIKNESGAQIGTISKKWAGAMKEVFTSADRYNVNIDSHYANNENKVAILASAITIDMVLKESK